MTATPALITDEREGLPSASGMDRILACPGSRNLSRGLVTIDKPWTRDGKTGHAVLSGEISEDELSDEEDEVLLATQRCNDTLEWMLGELGFTPEAQLIVEERLFLHNDKGDPVCSGKADRVYIENGRFFIPDFKMGHKQQLAPSMNAQLIVYALLVEEEHGISDGLLAIIPAWRRTPQPAKIDKPTLAQWRTRILEGLAEADKPDAPRRAGPHCDYCPGRSFCPQAWAIVEEASSFKPTDTVDELTELRRFDLAKHAEGTIRDFFETLHGKITENPEAIPGLILRPGKSRTTIKAEAATYDVLKKRFGIDQIMSAAKLSLTKLSNLSVGRPVTAKTLTKAGKEAKAAILQELGDLASTTQDRPTIERV